MRPRGLRASAAVPAPKRFGVFFSPCGTIPENWRPTQALMAPETDFTLSPILEPLRAVQERHRRVARHEHRVVAVQVRSDRQRARPGDDAHVDGDRPGQGTGRARGARTTSSTGRRAARRSTSTSPRRSAARRCCRRWSWASRAPTRSWRRWSRTCATGAVDQNDEYKRAIPIQPVDDPVQIYTRLTGQHAGGDDRADPGGAAEPPVGARLRARTTTAT